MISPTISSIIPKYAGPSLHPLPASFSRLVPIFSPDVGKFRTLGEISSPDFLQGISWPRPGRFLGRRWAGRFHIGRAGQISYRPCPPPQLYSRTRLGIFWSKSLYLARVCVWRPGKSPPHQGGKALQYIASPELAGELAIAETRGCLVCLLGMCKLGCSL